MSSKLAFIVFAVLLGAFIALRFVGKVHPAKARELVGGGALLLDVRSEGEFASGHIAGAKNIPLGDLARRFGEIEAMKDRPVVVYCASGIRSAMAKQTLRSHGFREVHDLGAMGRY